MARQHNGDPIGSLHKEEARRLATKYELSASEERRLGKILSEALSTGLAAEERLARISLIGDAVRDQGVQQFARFTAGIDWAAFSRRAKAIETLFNDDAPLFRLSDLADHTHAFVLFLKEHRDFLVQTGLPPHYFARCEWLYRHLGRLYDTRATSAPHPSDEIISAYPRAGEPPYRWIRANVDAQNTFRDLKQCDYSQADVLNGMDLEVAARIEGDRQRLFEAKIEILQILANAAEKGSSDGLWNSCVAVLNSKFNLEDMEFYLQLDRFYLGPDASLRLTAPNPKLTPGGISNLFQMIGHFETEIAYKLFDELAQTIPINARELLSNNEDGFRWRYFSIFGSSDRQTLENAIDATLAKLMTLRDYWLEYPLKVGKALRSQFNILVTVEMMPRHVAALGGIIQDLADELQARRDRGEHIIGPPTKNIFRRMGNSWTIQFDGSLVAKLDSDGLFYIAQLLAAPYKVLSAQELRSRQVAWKAPRFGNRNAGADTHALQRPASNLGELIDDEARANCTSEVSRLEDLMEEARRSGDVELVAECEQHIAMYQQYLTEGKGLGGRTRRAKPDSKKANDAVRNAIRRALDDLRESHRTLHKHFEHSLDLGGNYRYSPNPAVIWEL